MIASRSRTSTGDRPERRLIEQDQRGPSHQPACDRQHLLLAAAEIAALRIEPVAQDWEIVQHPVEVLRDRRAVGLHVGAQIEVVAHGHAAEDASPFGHQVDAHCRGAVGRTSPRCLAPGTQCSRRSA